MVAATSSSVSSSDEELWAPPLPPTPPAERARNCARSSSGECCQGAGTEEDGQAKIDTIARATAMALARSRAMEKSRLAKKKIMPDIPLASGWPFVSF